MSTAPETDLDLEKLFLPAWAQESPAVNRYAGFKGEVARSDDPREGRRGRGRPAPNRGERTGERRRPAPGQGRGDDRRGPRREGGPRTGGRGFGRPDERRERPEAPLPLPDLNVALIPDENGVESLARQIKTTGRAYPLFGIAQLILQKPERYSVRISVRKLPDGKIAQPLYVCALDDTLWLSEDEAVAHILRNHFATFYQAERTAKEPPKGKYTFVAQCGMSGVILGPPNYHDYQNQLQKLHAERFSRMPFEAFKARVKIVRDEEVVKKWVEEQSWKTEYLCLNLPEALKLPTMEEVEKHFRSVHKENIIKTVETHTLSGVVARSMRSQGLARLVRVVCEDQRRFPIQLATVLSQQFANHGLQFFKVNRTVTHVSVARPNYLDLETTPVSDGVRRIVEFIATHPKCTRRKLAETLAPSAPIPVPTPMPTPAPVEGAAATATAPAPAVPEPTPEQTALGADLHWLIHQGHVIEFANGVLETAKKPLPKPPKPAAKPAEAPAPVEAAAEAPTGPAPSEPAPEISTAPVDETPAEPAAEEQTVDAPEPAPAAPPEEAAPPSAEPTPVPGKQGDYAV